MSTGQTAKHYMPFGLIRPNQNTSPRQACTSDPASELSFDNVLQHLSIQCQVCHDPFQPVVLVFQIPQPAHLRRHQPLILFLPVEIRRRTYPGLAANLRNVVPSLPCLTINAFWASVNLDAFIASTPFPARKVAVGNSNSKMVQFLGRNAHLGSVVSRIWRLHSHVYIQPDGHR